MLNAYRPSEEVGMGISQEDQSIRQVNSRAKIPLEAQGFWRHRREFEEEAEQSLILKVRTQEMTETQDDNRLTSAN